MLLILHQSTILTHIVFGSLISLCALINN